MTGMVLSHTNGSSAHSESLWLRQNVHQFFGGFNWEDHSPDIQELRQTTSNGNQPLSLVLTVNQFFSAINWEGGAIAATPQADQSLQSSNTTLDAFTLEDFSDLF